jgi:kinesin family protein 4/21/27
LKATYVEIYQEQLRDLLVSESVPLQDRAQVAIREDPKGRIMVTGLTQVTINSVDDLLNALNFGSSIRQTDATNINARSSRSHAVFSLNLIQKKADTFVTPKQEKRMSTPVDTVSGAENVVTIDSKLHFVDLAGSERLKNTGATGDRAKEGISINAGLASLGKVIAQLSSKHPHSHISYRDSRLTRLLQDSLGGNAITFMVACVTPAVFHLSETLNTVHYAQRARAIQSKPEIQQSREEGDKQAAIDRLRAEVTFLRDQIRHSEHADNKGFDSRGRSEKTRGKEAELETQLMDMQENYNALSSRHAKLISELSKARDGDNAGTPLLNEAFGSNATERIQRSNSFAQAVEQMVLEYEKTIQSLEGSLSKTRSTLSNSESTLLEKETRIAYMETIQQQLQARIQKALDREQSNESYLNDLEMRMEGTATGEERNASLISELRKELTRVRESENSAEDYISTLEERLAEAEQDQEIMQSEIDRLEHVVERQRSIGRLDNLLGELDIIRQNEAPAVSSPSRQINGDAPTVNGHHDSYDPFRPPSRTLSSAAATRDENFEDAEPEQADSVYSDDGQTGTQDAINESSALAKAHSNAQDDLMADKVENLTQELFDLRSEHESVMTDYDKLQQKYQTALETLAKLEYDKSMRKEGDKSSFLAGAGVGEDGKAELDGQPSSSRSVSPELSSPHQSSSSLVDLIEKTEPSGSGLEQDTLPEVVKEEQHEATSVPLPGERQSHPEIELLKRLNAEQEVNAAELTRTYKSLHARHQATLQQVEELKQEVTKARDIRPSSPSFSPGYTKTYFSRRKSDDLMSTASDRASRSITSLKTIANLNLEEQPDARQSFDLNLNTVMNELTNRTDKVQALEAELATIRKEMENKQTIITGLTRERGSLKASLGVDFTVVQQMREQLLESENQIRSLQEQHAGKEREFESQIDSLRSTLAAHARQLPTPAEDSPTDMPGGFDATPTRDLDDQATGGASIVQAEEIARLQKQLASWEARHHETVANMTASESQLLDTIARLEMSMREADSGGSDGDSPRNASEAAAAAAAILEKERAKHEEVINKLQKEIEQYKATSTGHVKQLQELEDAYMRQYDEHSKSSNLSSQELKTHKSLVANLENQLQVHRSAISIHQESLESLQASHSKELDDLKTNLSSAESKHKQVVESLQKELKNAQTEKLDVLRSASSALGYQTDATNLNSQIKGLVEEGKEIHARHLKTTNELKAVQEELQGALNNTVELESKISELKAINEESIASLVKMTEREKKSSHLVEELEEQLNNTFDSHQATNNRLSTMQGEVAQKRIELERELENQKLRNQVLEVSMYPLTTISTSY